MLKVVSVSDKVDTAIDRLCRGVIPYHTNLDYVVCDVHPKRPDPQQLQVFFEAVKDADIIDYQYFRTAEMLRSQYPELKKTPSILTHNNPYSIHEGTWADYDIVVANNKTMEADLSTITTSRLEYVPLTVDTDFWVFNPDWQPEDQVIMVANRIESKKGILEVAIACAEVGMKFVLVGAISDRDYFESIMQTGDVEFHEQISDEALRDLYYKSKLHVCNSKDDFESGTLPILESMLCGVPVVTRNVGHVPDLNNGSNMIINEGSNEDVVNLIEVLKNALKDDLKTIRDKAWQTAKSRNNERRAYMYQKLYRSVVSDKKTVSVIMPINDNESVITACVQAVDKQTYDNIELVVCDDGEKSQKPLIDKLAKTMKIPVRYIYTYNNDYGLARARNLGAIEATGDVLVFCDQRQIMDSKAVEVFVNNLVPRSWLYGNKGVKKEFVENFSCITRNDFIKLGMFCERMDRYGGLSQESRSRAKYNRYHVLYINAALATPMGKSRNKHTKKQDIITIKNKLWKMGMEL